MVIRVLSALGRVGLFVLRYALIAWERHRHPLVLGGPYAEFRRAD